MRSLSDNQDQRGQKVNEVDSSEGSNNQRIQSRLNERIKTVMKIEKDVNVFKKDYSSPPPATLLPLIHPLTNYKIAHERKKLANVELAIKKFHSVGRETYLKNSWEDIHSKKLQLKELFITAEKGIKENRASMGRFYEIIKDNIAQKKSLEDERLLSLQKIEDYRKIEQELKHYVDRYSMFEKYLEDVAGVDDHSRTVRDVLDRYETLKITGAQCARILKGELEEAEDLRRNMLMMMEENASKLKALSNRLILTEVRRKRAHERRVYWEHMMLRIKYTILGRTQESVALREGINDLYHTMSSRLRVMPDIPRSYVQAQLNFIHKNIMFYKEVVTIASVMKSPEGVKGGDVKKKQSKDVK